MKLLYRVENLITNRGLWYNSDQSESGLVSELNLTNQFLPMDRISILSEQSWKSAAESLDQLKYWFTQDDINKLIPLGFKLYEVESIYNSTHTTELYSHPIFQEQGVLSRKALDINLLF